MRQAPKLILASGSSRRRKLLADAGISFETVESGLVETRGQDEGARDYAIRVAREKALAVSARSPESLVLSADTVVECAGRTLEKPEGPEQARSMLRLLSGRTHIVITAFALARRGVILESEAVLSRVGFRQLGDDEIAAYVATGEPLDKAGAYGIQGRGGSFISHVEGSRDNVMGLPVAAVIAALRRHLSDY